MTDNPYSLQFGKEPREIISRTMQTEEIISTFLSNRPSQQVFVITGIRGSGKTVLMTEVSKKIAQQPDWIVIELNPDRDMLTTLASKLASDHYLASIFKEASINLSSFGIGLEVNGTVPITDIEVALSKMIKSLARQKKRLLITVDEASNTEYLRVFCSSYQILVRQDLPVFLLMTGLYENMHSLQNEKALTFMYRAPKIELKPLNIGIISRNYLKNLPITDETALEMARLTKGYSFAFQVLGYFTFQEGELSENVLFSFKQYLDDYVYEKIWDEMSENDRRVSFAIAKTPSGKISEIRSLLQMETNQFNPYRKRLIKKGVVNGEQYGHVSFTLPLFDQYVVENYDL